MFCVVGGTDGACSMTGRRRGAPPKPEPPKPFCKNFGQIFRVRGFQADEVPPLEPLKMLVFICTLHIKEGRK